MFKCVRMFITISTPQIRGILIAIATLSSHCVFLILFNVKTKIILHEDVTKVLVNRNCLNTFAPLRNWFIAKKSKPFFQMHILRNMYSYIFQHLWITICIALSVIDNLAKPRECISQECEVATFLFEYKDENMNSAFLYSVSRPPKSPYLIRQYHGDNLSLRF